MCVWVCERVEGRRPKGGYVRGVLISGALVCILFRCNKKKAAVD